MCTTICIAIKSATVAVYAIIAPPPNHHCTTTHGTNTIIDVNDEFTVNFEYSLVYVCVLYNFMHNIVDVYEMQSRRHTDYEMGGRSSLYGDAYTNRLGRSNIKYGSSRSSMSDQDSHASYSGSEPGGMYSSSSYDGDYISRDSDVDGSSYSSSMYFGRIMSGSGYMGSGSSGSYY
nr:nucleolin [Tanacetum cinerariifolium]